jgi:hypothetical protein
VPSPLLPFARVAVNVYVTGSFYSTSSGDSSYKVSVTKHQQKAEREKFCGPSVNTAHTFVKGEIVIRALNDSHTFLLPFVIDPFGDLGPLANRFLLGIHPDPTPDPLVFQSATSQQAYDNLTYKADPSGLAHHADTSWSSNSAHLPFVHTYHIWVTTN